MNKQLAFFVFFMLFAATFVAASWGGGFAPFTARSTQELSTLSLPFSLHNFLFQFFSRTSTSSAPGGNIPSALTECAYYQCVDPGCTKTQYWGGVLTKELHDAGGFRCQGTCNAGNTCKETQRSSGNWQCGCDQRYETPYLS